MPWILVNTAIATLSIETKCPMAMQACPMTGAEAKLINTEYESIDANAVNGIFLLTLKKQAPWISKAG